ncbi:ROK family transcriptional regulator [Microbacterium sp. T2.11-28]|uniref:ROK family transcriptional regulator n=1 Tax=Microbacterium sp. T2.11-28 TaxID=3041169 RepID=UPI0024772E7F|nr:ROK family transcriptional regulator [Microbacterium sp. T2.11-28]CAI9394478.1 N-acetylglucosamine repressor [Microbacterium sp. T2.11-28]
MAAARSQTDVNRTAILAHLGAHGSASRADLARALEVSPALVTQLTRDLLADGLIEEQEAASSGGRPARLLGLVSHDLAAIGVKVAPDHVAFVEVGIDGVVRRADVQPFDAVSPLAASHLIDTVRRFIEQSGSARVLGIGVGLPGTVAQQGIGVVDSTQLGWVQVPLGEQLRRALHLPVVVENNVNALSAAEQLFGQGRRFRNVLVVTVGNGVGAGLIADGVIVRGRSGGAGDFGHVPVREDGPLCQCGNRGCLEAIIGQGALVNDARSIRLIDPDEGVDELRSLADAGNAEAREIFAHAGHQLGRAMAGAVNLLDPEVVVLLGEGVQAWSHWQDAFDAALRSALVPGKRGVTVEVERWDDDRWAQGAAALVLATPFDAQGVAGDQGRLVRERLVAAMEHRP